MSSFFIDYVGCPRRALDCNRIKNYMLKNGFTLAASPNDADYLFVSTCGFHNTKEDESIKMIKQYKHYHNFY